MIDPLTLGLGLALLYQLRRKIAPGAPGVAQPTPPALPSTPSQVPFPQAASVPAGSQVAPVSAPSPSSPPPQQPRRPPPTIRHGSTGTAVAHWQRIVGVVADGKFGPMTVAATRAFQAQHGLVADGIVGPKTWAAAGITDASQIPGLGTGLKAVEVFRPTAATAKLPRENALKQFPAGFVPAHPPTAEEREKAKLLLASWQEGKKWFEGSGDRLRVYRAVRH